MGAEDVKEARELPTARHLTAIAAVSLMELPPYGMSVRRAWTTPVCYTLDIPPLAMSTIRAYRRQGMCDSDAMQVLYRHAKLIDHRGHRGQ